MQNIYNVNSFWIKVKCQWKKSTTQRKCKRQSILTKGLSHTTQCSTRWSRSTSFFHSHAQIRPVAVFTFTVLQKLWWYLTKYVLVTRNVVKCHTFQSSTNLYNLSHFSAKQYQLSVHQHVKDQMSWPNLTPALMRWLNFELTYGIVHGYCK